MALSSRYVESTKPGRRHIVVSRNGDDVNVCRVSKSGRLNSFSLSREEVYALSNILIDMVEPDDPEESKHK